MSLRLGELYVATSWQSVLIFWAAPVVGVATFFQLGLYRLVTRYIGAQGAVLIAVGRRARGPLSVLVVRWCRSRA